MKILHLLFISFLTVSSLSVLAQANRNDECTGAIFLSAGAEYCSGLGEFDNLRATPSPQAAPSCFDRGQNGDVWFSFRAATPGVSIRIVGGTRFFSGGSLRQPQAALYAGSCNGLTLLDCDADDQMNQNNAFTHVSTLEYTNLNIGDTYFFRVEGQDGNIGTFQICITQFIPALSPNSDCPTGVLLCDKSPFIVPFLNDNGNIGNEVTGPPCSGTNCVYDELQSVWYKWICKDPGTLTFTLTPLNPTDDLDFWIYELPNGYDDCSNKIPLLCMAAGENQSAPISQWIRCHGPTGLRNGETDDHENCGCPSGNNSFIMPLQMEAGKAYALVVMNFSSTGDGFGVTFGGTGTFVGPDVAFDIDPELDNQCDVDTIVFTDLSTPGIGKITKYEWNFGNGSLPHLSGAQGPHEVFYESFGTKNIVLRITTDAGCAVTQIRSIYIKPCCDPNDALTVDLLDVRDPLCPGTETGFFSVTGSRGNPDYLYSLNGVDFGPNTEFSGLTANTYNIWITDIKGCRDSIEVSLIDPPPFSVDAGPDQTIDLGEETDLRATVVTNSPSFDAMWRQDTTLSCLTCLDPHVRTYRTITYYIEASTPVGCRAADSVTVFVQISRPVFIPSGFSPNDDGINDNFTVYTGPQARLIKRLLVFDRWGDLVYEGKDIVPNVETLGWDGKFKGKRMDPGVFAYFTEVEFLDGVVIPFEGDVTLVK